MQNERGSLDARKEELVERLERGPDPERHGSYLDWGSEKVDLKEEKRQVMEEGGQRRIAQGQEIVRRQWERRGDGG